MQNQAVKQVRKEVAKIIQYTKSEQSKGKQGKGRQNKTKQHTNNSSSFNNRNGNSINNSNARNKTKTLAVYYKFPVRAPLG